MGEKSNACRKLVGKSEGKRLLEDLDIVGMEILKQILKKSDGVVRTGLIWFRIGTSGGGLL
jgi:hypothetical protein